MTPRRTALLIMLALGATAARTQDAASRPAPTVEYRITCERGEDPRLRVLVRVRGLDRSRRDVRFELPGWGEWYEVDDYYVRRLRAVPPARHHAEFLERFPVDVPEGWDGTLEASYDVPIVSLVSRAHRNRGLLPWSAKNYVHAFSTNTLVRVAVGDERQDADRRLTLVPPAGWGTFTGWAGFAAGEQSIRIPPAADNTLIVFGAPAAVAKSADGSGLEIVQFGMHADRTALLLDFARRMRAAYEASTGAPPPSVGRLVVTEPGLGGTHVEGAITIGHPDVEPDGRFEIGTAHFLAHEMFHSWLPGVLKPGQPGLEWFFEGFTEYWSLWHLVVAGAATAQQFGDRLRWYEHLAAESPASGKVRFDDLAVKWREPDAEVVAYKGGALLAFHLDVAVRTAGKPGLPMLFRDLVRDEGSRYSLDAIRRWVEAQGLAAFWKDHVATGRLPDTGDALIRMGFVETLEGKNRIVKDDPAKTASFFKFVPPR